MKRSFSLNLISLSHGLFFFVVCFFAICFANPQYSGSFYSSSDGDFPFIFAVWMVVLFGLLFLASFFIERMFEGDKRVYASLAVSFAALVLLLIFALFYFDKRGSLEPSVLIPRVVLILASFVLLFVPVFLNFSRYKKPGLFPKMEEWKRYPFEGALFALAQTLALLVLLCVDLIPNATGTPIGEGVPLIFLSLALAVSLGTGGYWIYLYRKESLIDSRALSSRMLYAAVIELVLPLISIFLCLYFYDNGTLAYQSFYCSLFLYGADVVLALLEGAKAAYANKGI